MPKQLEFEVTPKSELGQAAEKYIEARDKIEEAKLLLKPCEDLILTILKREKRTAFAVPYNDEVVRFTVESGKAKLKVKKTGSKSTREDAE